MSLARINTFCFLLSVFCFSSVAYGAQPNLDVPEGVLTKVTLSPGRVETNPLPVGIRKGIASMKIGRANFTDPNTAVTIQLWALINGVWTQSCSAKTAGRPLASQVSAVGCGMKGGTQTKAIIFTTGSPFSTTLLYEIK